MYIQTDGKGNVIGSAATRQPWTLETEFPDGCLDGIKHPMLVDGKIIENQDMNTADAAVEMAEASYSYARARAQAYVQAFSKDPKQNPVDALGHVVDAILSHIAGDSMSLNEIQAKRAEIKMEHPKE